MRDCMMFEGKGDKLSRRKEGRIKYKSRLQKLSAVT